MCFSCYLYREVDRNKIHLDFFCAEKFKSVPTVITSVTLIINFSCTKMQKVQIAP